MAGIKKAADFLESAVMGAALIVLSVMFAAILLQIFTRYVLNDPLIWTEELANICFAWIVFLGAAVGVKRNESVKMDLFLYKLSDRAKNILDILQTLLLFGLSVWMLPFGYKLILQVLPLEMNALRVSWVVLYAPAPVFFLLIILFSPAMIRDFLKKGAKEK